MQTRDARRTEAKDPGETPGTESSLIPLPPVQSIDSLIIFDT